jgi:hypothetical protein
MMRRVIGWDLDENLGCFRPPEANKVIKHLPARRGVVQGMKTLLEDLSSRDCVNVVTTAAPLAYAEEALDRYGLSRHFAKIFEGTQVCPNNGFKQYKPVADYFGLSEANVLDKLMVIGNEDRDSPKDIPVVFIYNPNSMKFDASPVRFVIEAMEGHGSWWWGFHALMNSGGEKIRTDYFEGTKVSFSDVEVATGRLIEHPFYDISVENMVLIMSASDKRKKELE